MKTISYLGKEQLQHAYYKEERKLWIQINYEED